MFHRMTSNQGHAHHEYIYWLPVTISEIRNYSLKRDSKGGIINSKYFYN